MAEKNIIGYLVNKIPYKVFDEVITFIDKTGKKYSCLSLGSKKIASKNGRNLFLGSLIEFQIFESRNENKLSRLKKASVINENDWKMEIQKDFIMLNLTIIKAKYTSKEFYRYYKNMLELIKSNKYGEQINELVILKTFIQLVGIFIELNECIVCGSSNVKNFSVNNKGVLCPICAMKIKDKHNEIILSNLQQLFNGNYLSINNNVKQTIFVLKTLVFKN
ncbi:MAG: DNA repair protein RecO [Mycoplasmataceae bacterium]|jgi:DNA repair protein RecO (recombination protein O)|nr:DNA repair protein RecO [Mycoplasmataceae bacterium]